MGGGRGPGGRCPAIKYGDGPYLHKERNIYVYQAILMVIVAQWREYQAVNLETHGLIPADHPSGSVAQPARAPDCLSGRRGFESRQARHLEIKVGESVLQPERIRRYERRDAGLSPAGLTIGAVV